MIIVFDIPDEFNLQSETVDDLVQKTSLFSLSTQWRWFGGAHLDNLIVAVPEAEAEEERDADSPDP